MLKISDFNCIYWFLFLICQWLFCCCLVPTDNPTSFSANAISPNIINTTWEPPTAYNLGGVITSYTLTYAGRERDYLLKTKIRIVLNGSIYITPALTELQEDTHYLISVRANTSVGAGPWTNLIVHTPEDGEPVILSSILYPEYSWIIPLLYQLPTFQGSIQFLGFGFWNFIVLARRPF